MSNDKTDAGDCPAPGGGDRPEFTLTPRNRAGPDYHGGLVVRVFPPYREDGYPAARVAQMVTEALHSAATKGQSPRLVVLPAGVGTIPTIRLPTTEWEIAGRLTVGAALAAWGRSCGRHLPAEHPPVVLGLDGAVDFDGGGPWPQAVQAALVLDQKAVVHVTHKTHPRDGSEATALDVARDPVTWRPTENALAWHDPVATIHGERVLMLVCHDAAIFSARSRAASTSGGNADVIRGQYDTLLTAPDAPRLAVNLLHQLPRKPAGRIMTSPVFQNAHNALHDRGVRVIAVSGLNPACAPQAFERVSVQLRCDARRIDVLIED